MDFIQTKNKIWRIRRIRISFLWAFTYSKTFKSFIYSHTNHIEYKHGRKLRGGTRTWSKDTVYLFIHWNINN